MKNISTQLIGTYGDSGGGSAPGIFRNPAAFITDTKRNLIVCDTGNHRIQKLDQNGNVLWIVGGITSDGKPKIGTAPSEFYNPRAICTDADDYIYVCDSFNCRVKKYDPMGNLIMMFGAQGNDEGQFGGVGPEGIDVSDDGSIFVADSHTIRGGNHRIQIFNADGCFIDTYGSYGTTDFQFAGTVAIREYGFDFGPGIGPGPEGPVGIALLRNPISREFAYFRKNMLFCADTDNERILVITPQGDISPVIGKGIVHRPRQVSLDSNDNIFVTDIHSHVPVWDSVDMDKQYKWRIDRNCSWIWVFTKIGDLIGRVGVPDAHDIFGHEGAGLHWHGDAIAVDRSDDQTLYVQGHHMIFKMKINLGEIKLPLGGIPTKIGT